METDYNFPKVVFSLRFHGGGLFSWTFSKTCILPSFPPSLRKLCSTAASTKTDEQHLQTVVLRPVSMAIACQCFQYRVDLISLDSRRRLKSLLHLLGTLRVSEESRELLRRSALSETSSSLQLVSFTNQFCHCGHESWCQHSSEGGGTEGPRQTSGPALSTRSGCRDMGE